MARLGFLHLCVIIIATETQTDAVCHPLPIKFPRIVKVHVADDPTFYTTPRLPQNISEVDEFEAATVTVEIPTAQTYTIHDSVWSLQDFRYLRFYVRGSQEFHETTGYRANETHYGQRVTFTLTSRKQLLSPPTLTIFLNLHCAYATLYLNLRRDYTSRSRRLNLQTFTFNRLPFRTFLTSNEFKTVNFEFSGPQGMSYNIRQLAVRANDTIYGPRDNPPHALASANSNQQNGAQQNENGRISIQWRVKLRPHFDNAAVLVRLEKYNLHSLVPIVSAQVILSLSSAVSRDPVFDIKACRNYNADEHHRDDEYILQFPVGYFACFSVALDSYPQIRLNPMYMIDGLGLPARPVYSSSRNGIFQYHRFVSTERLKAGDELTYFLNWIEDDMRHTRRVKILAKDVVADDVSDVI